MGLRRSRRSPRRRKAPRWTAAQWEAASGRLLRRAGWRCERCGASVTADTAERHHRRRRAAGGDRLSNLLLLCRLCHPWIHNHPREARASGWIIPAESEEDPTAVPFVRHGGYRWLLDDQGAAHPLP